LNYCIVFESFLHIIEVDLDRPLMRPASSSSTGQQDSSSMMDGTRQEQRCPDIGGQLYF
jgi:hypothetical protein